MSVFDGILGDWIQIIDDKNETTIDNYAYNTGVIKGTTGNHCVKCVAVNKCYFKNIEGKKPQRFDLTGIKILDLLIKGLVPGLYHIGCHCKEVPVEVLSLDEIKLIIPDGKIQYLFVSKGDWIRSMGYTTEDDEVFVDTLLQKTKEAYFYGDYTIEIIDKYGCKINLLLNIPGIRNKQGKMYRLKTNYMIFPNLKLKMNTPIGGWWK